MKLRIQDNSVRFRMTVKELEQLAADGRIERRTQFPRIGGVSGAQFTYGIQVDQGAGASRTEYSNGAVTAFLCRADIQRLQDDYGRTSN